MTKKSARQFNNRLTRQFNGRKSLTDLYDYRLYDDLHEAYLESEKARGNPELVRELAETHYRRANKQSLINPAILILSQKFDKSEATISKYATIFAGAHYLKLSADELIHQLRSTGIRNLYLKYKELPI